jgi:hypothetical protein
MVSLWNSSAKDQDLILTLFYSGGQYKYAIHLQANGSTMISVKELQEMGGADSAGNVLPKTVTDGSAWLSASSGLADDLDVIVSVGTFNAATATCGTMWPTCLGWDAFWIDADTLGIDVGDDAQTYAYAENTSGGIDDVTAQSTWTSSNTSVAQVVSAGVYYGEAAGSFNAEAAITLISAVQDCVRGSPCATDGWPAQVDGTVQAQPPGCPTDINIGSTTALPLQNPTTNYSYPNLKTGIGIVAQMVVSDPNGTNWNGALITESLTAGSDNCPSIFPAACSSNPATFVVGSGGGTTMGVPIPATTNAFWDEHAKGNGKDLLTVAGISTCQSVCLQGYSCRGTPINNQFTITNTFTKGTIGGVSVTNVTTTKALQ